MVRNLNSRTIIRKPYYLQYTVVPRVAGKTRWYKIFSINNLAIAITVTTTVTTLSLLFLQCYFLVEDQWARAKDPNYLHGTKWGFYTRN